MGSENILFKAADIITVTHGTIRGERLAGDEKRLAGRTVTGITVDSRECGQGSLFVALKGERTDGHLFLEDAYSRGSRIFLVEAGSRVSPAGIGDAVCVEVADTLAALQSLARYHLARMPDVRRIGITGSNGKTTTKELVGSILTRAARTAMNRGNLNSEIGLPLAAFEVRLRDTYAVFEMAMDHEGEMDILSDIVRPDAALITNIGNAHIGRLGSVQAIAAEKKKIFSRFTGGQMALVPDNDPWSPFLKAGVDGRIVEFGERSTPGFEGAEDRGLEGSILGWKGMKIRLPLPGRHNVLNALGAITLASELAIDPETIREGLENTPTLFGRCEIIEGSVTVLQDCYNANPDSMRKALEFVKSLRRQGRKILVLGSMKELGDNSIGAHAELGRLAAGCGADAVFFFGSETGSACESLRSERFEGKAHHTEKIDELISVVRDFIREGDFVLVKGSRAVALERLTKELVGHEAKTRGNPGRNRVS